ncbi:protein kinase [Nocardioides sp. TF02-7]|uniref:protein kinase domain-containing protein n=1 Tax=Nocardioides sp. TF02-7 TaxID=2917724 RepID=UPI001F0643B5|nr:protein kinase [Nocardioides sp. TF02-7]UMG92810.1 protein kinase [Nocardioides sp. TF02-7]
MSEQQYLPLAVDLASALHFFRHADVCHLDIKPSNVIMGSPARLIDFSVARSSASAAEITSLIGTDAYMAPEQAVPGIAGDVPGYASDVWGLGATLFHAIAGGAAVPRRRPARDGAGRAPPAAARPAAGAAGTGPPRPSPRSCTPLSSRVPRTVRSRGRVVHALEPVLAALPAPKLTFKVNARAV